MLTKQNHLPQLANKHLKNTKTLRDDTMILKFLSERYLDWSYHSQVITVLNTVMIAALSFIKILACAIM